MGIKSQVTFIDLFAGIGGMRLGFESAGARCVFTNEINPFAQKTYFANFPSDNYSLCDIQFVDPNRIPKHDILLAGFPCQPFSIAGIAKRKTLNKPIGFEDLTQGNMFFEIIKILKNCKPRAFLLENVPNILSMDRGRTFLTIREHLQSLGYVVAHTVVNSIHWKPTKRKRLFIVGFQDDVSFSFGKMVYPHHIGGATPVLKDILHSEDGKEMQEPPYTQGALAQVSPKYTLLDSTWLSMQLHKKKHQERGNGFGYRLYANTDVAGTLLRHYHKGADILINQEDKNPRRLTPRECARLMGFPNSFKIPVSDTQAYKQFGNSVVVDVIGEIAKLMVQYF